MVVQKKAARALADKVIEAHLRQLKRHVEKNGVKGLERLYKEARGEILARLLRIGKGKDTVEGLTLRTMQKQIDDALMLLGKNIEVHLKDIGKTTAELGARQGIDEYRKLHEYFTGTLPIVNLDVPARMRGLVKGVESSLLRRHSIQAKTWTAGAVQAMEQRLSLAAAARRPLEETIDDLMGTPGMDGLRYRAERIVRTEGAYAHGSAKQAAIEETSKELEIVLFKRLIETFDDRTGDDSFLVHGQTVPADQPFEWKHKVRGKWLVTKYMHPPNRPNDRAVVIPWDPEWEETAAERPYTRGELRGAPTTRYRKTVGVKIPPGHKPGQPYTYKVEKKKAED